MIMHVQGIIFKIFAPLRGVILLKVSGLGTKNRYLDKAYSKLVSLVLKMK